MFLTRRSAIGMAVVITAAGSLLVPDYSSPLWPTMFKAFLLPALISLPLAMAVFRSPAVLSLPTALLFCLLCLFGHVAISGFVFWLWAGAALFDGLSIPIFLGTFAVGALTSGLVFVATSALYRYRATHAG